MSHCAYSSSTHPSNDLLNPFLVAFHLQERLDLADGQVLPIAEGDQFIERAEQLVGILEDFPLIQTLAGARDNLGEEMERIDVLEDVRLLVGDQDHVELVQGLVYESNIVLLDRGVLRSRVGRLGEGG